MGNKPKANITYHTNILPPPWYKLEEVIYCTQRVETPKGMADSAEFLLSENTKYIVSHNLIIHWG
jgi:hypothetical protein